MSISKYLLLPHLNKHDSGYGHIIRCLRIAVDMAKKYYVDVLLSSEQVILARPIIKIFNREYLKEMQSINVVQEPRADYNGIIFDKKEVSKDLVNNFLRYGPIIGIDSGGEGREYLPYLIDTLPNTLPHKPNLYALTSLINPEISPKKTWATKCRNILYYTDSSALEDKLQFVASILANSSIHLTVISTSVEKYSSLIEKFSNLRVQEVSLNIIKNISQYDLLITHFGIMAYEAIASKVPVVLFNETKYHQHLAKHVHFPKTYYQNNTVNALASFKNIFYVNKYKTLGKFINQISSSDAQYEKLIVQIKNMPNYSKISTSAQSKYISTIIADLFDAYQKSQVNKATNIIVNPWLGISCEKAIYRNTDKTIFLCKHTRQYHQISFVDNFPNYSNEYFLSEYKQQYGKTYLEDYPSILNKMLARMKTIARNIVPEVQATKTIKPVICDIGSAYGTMLQAVAEKGYTPLGIEINKEAVNYCNNTLRYKAIVGDVINESLSSIFKKQNIDDSKIIAFTAFFLIEHLPNIQQLLYEVHKILPLNGMFVCAVPNGSGISARLNKLKFFFNSPIDHFSIFTPRGLSTILVKSGFRIIKINITGHHPERFGFPRIMNKFFLFISKLCKLGDTFEIYATKHW